MRHNRSRSWNAAIRAVQKNLLKFSAHVPVSDEQDKILGAVYLPCDQLRAKKSLHAATTNCQLAKKYATDCPFRHNHRARKREAFAYQSITSNMGGFWRICSYFISYVSNSRNVNCL